MKKILTAVLIVIAITILPFSMVVRAEDVVETDSGTSYRNPVLNADGTVTWDCVWFGNYWQNDTNGDDIADTSDNKEPIKWRVLCNTADDLFLISDMIIDAKPYNTSYMRITWEYSTVRSWLNGYSMQNNSCGEDYSLDNFINSVFSEAEKTAIKTTNVDNSTNTGCYNGYYSADGGNDTNDKLFLLSYKDSVTEAYGFPTDCNDSKTRAAVPTAYARYRGTPRYGYATDKSWWWLRSPSASSSAGEHEPARYAMRVLYNGFTGKSTDYSDGSPNNTDSRVNSYNGVRPALHISPSSSYISYAGTVCSDGTMNEISPGGGEEGNSYTVTFDSNGGSSWMIRVPGALL